MKLVHLPNSAKIEYFLIVCQMECIEQGRGKIIEHFFLMKIVFTVDLRLNKQLNYSKHFHSVQFFLIFLISKFL